MLGVNRLMDQSFADPGRVPGFDVRGQRVDHGEPGDSQRSPMTTPVLRRSIPSSMMNPSSSGFTTVTAESSVVMRASNTSAPR
jgi:hypothetical protein